MFHISVRQKQRNNLEQRADCIQISALLLRVLMGYRTRLTDNFKAAYNRIFLMGRILSVPLYIDGSCGSSHH